METEEFTIYPLINGEDMLKMMNLIESYKALTDYFIMNLVIKKSNILIVMVGVFNYPEQKLLSRIKKENKNINSIPPLLF